MGPTHDRSPTAFGRSTSPGSSDRPGGPGIRRDSFEPAYAQLAGILRSRIVSGEFQAGDRLPTETELVAGYGLSPMTVRRAIKVLLDERAVSTVPGRGTFVEAASIQAAAFDLGSFQALLMDPAIRVQILATSVVPASGRPAEMLGVRPGTEVTMIRRLLLRGVEPRLYHRQWMIDDPRRPVVESELEVTGLRNLFEGRAGSGPKRGRLRLYASALRGEEARRLGAQTGHPAFVLEHLFFGFDDRPLSWGLFVSRAEDLRFETTIGFDQAPDARPDVARRRRSRT
jgi:GntR family transcriptional regulator